MKKILVIGTIHNMMPKHKNELKDMLEKINPDQILVEIADKHIGKQQMNKYPEEVIFAYNWALKNKKKADGFDSDIKYEKKISKKYYKELIKEATEIIDRDGWKEHNKRKHDNQFAYIVEKLVYMNKLKLMQKKMLQNVK